MSDSNVRKQTSEERKVARAHRNAELKAHSLGGSNITTKVAAVEEQMRSKEQIRDSRTIIDTTKSKGLESISNIQISRIDTENQRRQTEARLQEERSVRIENLLEDGKRINAEISEKWTEVASHTIPQELYTAISHQYKRASHLLSMKDELIKYLQQTLKVKDEEYVESLAAHQEDINLLLQRMKETFSSFLQTIKKELSGIEELFIKEHDELSLQHREEIDAMYEKRRKLEISIMESKQIREKKCAYELLEIRNRDAEDYNSLKIDLENSIQIFEQQLEEMRATYQLNSEKLEYNHSVLIERDLENKATVEHHRQQLRKLKENLSVLITKFQKSDTHYKQENRTLTDEYHRSTESFKDLQKKYSHFVSIDTSRYQEVWVMKEENCMSCVKKVLEGEQIITEQILGWKWRPPLTGHDLEKIVVNNNGTGTNAVINSLDTKYNIAAITSAQIFQAGQQSSQVNQQQQRVATAAAAQAAQAAAAQAAAANGGGGGSADGIASSPTSSSSPTQFDVTSSPSTSTTTTTTTNPNTLTVGSKFTAHQVKTVMDLLSTEINFLVDSRIQETVQALAERATGNLGTTASELEKEQDMYRADGILSALGVEDREDLDSLVSLFYESNENGTTTISEKPIVHPNDVARVVSEFVLKRQQVKTKSSAASTAGGGGSSSSSTAQPPKHHDSVLSEKKARRKERERLFWYRLGHIVPESTLTVWDHLEEELPKYNQLLDERAQLIEDTTRIAKENEEMKILLQGYLSSKVNSELQIPPTRLIRVNQ